MWQWKTSILHKEYQAHIKTSSFAWVCEMISGMLTNCQRLKEITLS